MDIRRSHITRSGLVPTLTFVLALFLGASGLPAQENLEPAVEAFFAAARSGKLDAVSRAAAPLQAHPEAAAELVASGLCDRSSAEIVIGLRALKLIGSAGDDGTIIRTLLAHPEADVRAEAVLTGGKILGAPLLPRILEAVRDEGDVVRRRAFDMLLEIEPQSPSVVKAALEGLYDSDWWVSSTSFRILEAQTDKDVQEQIGKHFAHNVKRLNAQNAAKVFATLARRWPRRAVPALIHGLRSADDAVVKAALTVVEKYRIRDALPDVREIVEGKSPALAAQAARCLGTMRDRKSLPLLVDLLESSRDPATREAAAVSLRHISGRLHGYDVARWREYLLERQIAER